MQINIHEEKNCNTEAECRRLCEQNPDLCPGFKDSDDYQRFLEEKDRTLEEYERIQEKPRQYETDYQFPSE